MLVRTLDYDKLTQRLTHFKAAFAAGSLPGFSTVFSFEVETLQHSWQREFCFAKQTLKDFTLHAASCSPNRHRRSDSTACLFVWDEDCDKALPSNPKFNVCPSPTNHFPVAPTYPAPHERSYSIAHFTATNAQWQSFCCEPQAPHRARDCVLLQFSSDYLHAPRPRTSNSGIFPPTRLWWAPKMQPVLTLLREGTPVSQRAQRSTRGARDVIGATRVFWLA